MSKVSLLDLSKVRTGDIVLEAGNPGDPDGIVWKIRVATLSRFTHVTVMVTRLGALEAPGEGARTHLRRLRVLRDESGRNLADPGATHVVVLRPRASIEKRWRRRRDGAGSLREETPKAVLAYLGREYPSRWELARALAWPFRQLARRFLDKPPDNAFVGRWSCSSLVAQVYADVGLPLRQGDVRTVTPVSIRRSLKLRRVKGAVVRVEAAERDRCTVVLEADVVEGTVSAKTLESLFADAAAFAASAGTGNAADALAEAVEPILRAAVPAYRRLLETEHLLLGPAPPAED